MSKINFLQMTRRLSPRSVGRSALGPPLFLLKIPFPLLGLRLFSPSVRKHCDSPPSPPGSCGRGPGVPPPGPQSSHLYSEVSARLPHLLLPLHLVLRCSAGPGGRDGVSAQAGSAAGRAVPWLSRLIWPQQGCRQLVTSRPGAGADRWAPRLLPPWAPPPCAQPRASEAAKQLPAPAPGRT